MRGGGASGMGCRGPRAGVKKGRASLGVRVMRKRITARYTAGLRRGRCCVARARGRDGADRRATPVSEGASAGRWACGLGAEAERGTGRCAGRAGWVLAHALGPRGGRLGQRSELGRGGCGPRVGAGKRRPGRYWVGFWVSGWAGFSIFPFYFLFTLSIQNLIQTKFEFKFEFESKPHSNKIMHQHECNKNLNL